MGTLWIILGIIGVIILLVIFINIFKAMTYVVSEENRLVVYRLGRFNRVIGPGMVQVIPWVEQVVRTLEVRDHPMEVTVKGIFAFGVPNDLTLNLWCSFDPVRAAGSDRHELTHLIHLSDAERRQQVEVKMREALVNQIAELQKNKPLPQGSTPLDAVIALAPGTERYGDLITGLKRELEKTLPTVGIILNSAQSINLTGRVIPDAIINAIKRMQGRQIDSQWLTKYASQLQQQFPEISSVVLDQMLASVDGVEVGNVQRLLLEQDERTDSQVELEVPMGGSDTPEVVAKPKIKLGDSETRRPAVTAKAAPEPPKVNPTHLTKSDLAVLKRVPRAEDREKQRLSA